MIKDQDLDVNSLYLKIREYVSKFIVHHGFVIDYISALVLFSYFQDKFATVPYTMFVGDNESGKSSIGDVFEVLAYRNVNMTDPTTANLFRIFGTIEAGQCTLVLDEAEKIDEDKDIMSILKTGYQYGKKVQRINQFGKQEHFHTYGLKIMLAERTPIISKAKGVLDRTFVISNFKGKPELDIKDIKNPRNKVSKEIAIDLNFLRKSILIYRLIHFNEENIEINTQLEGRDKELCNPLLKLFFKTNFQERLEFALETLLNEKKNRKANTLEREILEVMVDLFTNHHDGKIPFVNIWSSLAEKIGGNFNDYKPQEMETDGYGTIYKNTLSKTLRDRFGASDPVIRNSKARSLQFSIKGVRQNLEDYRKDQILHIVCHPINSDSSDSNDRSDSSRKDPFESFFKTSSLVQDKVDSSLNHGDIKTEYNISNKEIYDKVNNPTDKVIGDISQVSSKELPGAVIAVTPVTNNFQEVIDLDNFNREELNNFCNTIYIESGKEVTPGLVIIAN
ncbi:MAG: ATP-binding protein [Candidatus Nitrosocosmicus sp.]|nr:ATP-binding protein [Candidatus Nitrosocosmicus sp.]MDN5867952.1 ATP-binding protein [Candidatus Nitrosocosmicus sp.]